jgi:uncharacterized small protein (DUF1192 family)
MPGENTTLESAPAGKAGETTAAASAASARTVDPKNLTPAGVASLLDSAFAEPPETPARAAGSEVPPTAAKAGGDKSAEPNWSADQTAWFDLRAKASTPEEIAAADAQAPEFSEAQKAWIESQSSEPSDKSDRQTLPAEVLEQVKAWEDAGGALPPPLQTILDKRIGREVGKVKELEQRATTAEAEVTRLTTELETRNSERPAAVSGGLDEKSLSQMVETSKKFQADARAVFGGYADEQQKTRLEKHMQATGQDENAIRRQLDEVNDWLSEEVPQLRQRVQTFRATEAKIIPIVKARFPSLEQKGGDAAKWAEEVTRLMPELSSRTPAHKLALGVYALGKVAWDHLSQASADGDVIEALKSVLGRHVPLPANGHGQGGPRFFLPGKAPAKAPTVGGRAFIAPRVEGRAAQEEALSQKLRDHPTAENVTESLRSALR